MGFDMNSLIRSLLLACFSASLFATAHAATNGMTKGQYDKANAQAKATYESDRAKCDILAGNAKDICVAEADATMIRAEGSAKAAYKGTRKARYEQQVKNADADYRVAREKCDERGGNGKDVCVKEAKAARTKTIADAKAQQKAGEAQGEARKEIDEARHAAAVDKRDAEYDVAIQRCDDLAGDAKDACVQRAKQTFGKS
jgi:hypothetical protein